MALVNDHVTDASEKKMGGQDAGSVAVARSTDFAHVGFSGQIHTSSSPK